MFCGIDIAWGVLMLLAAVTDSDLATGIVPALVLLAIPATLMGLLWGSESARRFFDRAPSAYAPAPVSPPVGFAQPPGASGSTAGPGTSRRPPVSTADPSSTRSSPTADPGRPGPGGRDRADQAPDAALWDVPGGGAAGLVVVWRVRGADDAAPPGRRLTIDHAASRVSSDGPSVDPLP